MPRRRSSRRSSSRRSGTSVAGEVQRLFRQGDQVDTTLLLSLRQKYGDEELADRVRDAFVERHSMVIRNAKKFAQAVRNKYVSSNIPYHQILMKAQLHARKHGLSQAEFAEFQRMYEQELAGTSRANEVVLPLNTMIKVLGNLSGTDGRSSGFSISENDYRNVQSILRLYEESRQLHSQVVIQNLGYDDNKFRQVVVNGTLSKARHNPGEHVHPVVAALFGPAIPVVQSHFIYSNLAGIVSNLYNRKPLRTRPDYELYYNLITDPNDIVCDSRSPVLDLLQRANLQNHLWNAVLHLRNGQHYNSSFREFMSAVDVCRLNKHDSPDLVYGRHDGTVFKRLINSFSFRPTVVATIPVNAVFANNPYAQNVRPTITNIPMINVRLLQFQTADPVRLNAVGAPVAPPANLSLNDAVNQVQTFIEGNMLVNRVTNVISSRQVLFFYVDRRAHVLNVGMRHFNLNNLPKSVAGLERTNTKEINVPATIHCGSDATKNDGGNWVDGTEYYLRSAVCVDTIDYKDVMGGNQGIADVGLDSVKLVKGSKTIVFNNRTTDDGPREPNIAGNLDAFAAPPTGDSIRHWTYNPVEAISDPSDSPKCWISDRGRGENVQEMLNTTATVLVYQSQQKDERLGLVAV